MNNTFDTPILFLVFNRPDTTQLVFDQISKLKPKYLFIAADGPRNDVSADLKKCTQVKQIVSLIDWDCEVKTLFRDENLGCGKAVSSAITWFFNNVEYGIVLEDDIFPDMSFFHFCSQLLIKYKDDTRVGMITGININNSNHILNDSYFFSKFAGNIWGWATWRRVWNEYDYGIKLWGNPEFKKLLLNIYPLAVRFEKYLLFNKLYKNQIDTWDYQWNIARLLQNGLTIVPRKNLCINIGIYHPDATHHASNIKSTIKMDLNALEGELIHPKYFFPFKGYDYKYLFQKYTLINFIKKVLNSFRL